MIKDRVQKKLAARYCAVQGMIPFVEVIVRSFASVDDMPINITDVDVLGVEIRRSGSSRRTIYDCKTANRQSGINRALWGSGLRHLIGAEAGFVIQPKAVPDTHRLAAAAMGINIHTEDGFRRYATSLNSDFQKDCTYLDDMDAWDTLLASTRANQRLGELVFFITTQSALETSGPKGVRLSLSSMLKASGELDPSKPLHRAIFGCSLSAFLMHIAISVALFKDVFDFGMARNDFEQRLRYFLWEGRENYELRSKLRRALAERSGAHPEQTAEFDLPDWPRLVELVRGYLEAPEAVAQLPLIIKELAFRNLSPARKGDAEHRLRSMVSTGNRSRQFIFSGLSYFVGSTSLPKAFQKLVESELNELLA